ncbi:MAG: hypothetical protein FJ134_07965 [Deltaproteobacteria bacterium]|nr:hypothetical protein [Deltaproteobacteria bacterium]
MDKEIYEFVIAIGATAPQPGDEVYHLWKKAFKRANYFLLENNFLIIKISRTEKYFWGVGKKYIDFLNNSDNYFLVLLINNREGYVYSKQEININIENGYWKLREDDQNYKIYPAVVKEKNSFSSPKQFLKTIGMERISR